METPNSEAVCKDGFGIVTGHGPASGLFSHDLEHEFRELDVLEGSQVGKVNQT
jgi:hypothetical protein